MKTDYLFIQALTVVMKSCFSYCDSSVNEEVVSKQAKQKIFLKYPLHKCVIFQDCGEGSL